MFNGIDNLVPGGSINAHWLIILFGAGLVVAWLLGHCAIRWIGPLGFLDVPGGRKRHRGVMPRVGGFAFAGVLVLGAAFGWLPGFLEWHGWLGLFLVFLLGALDDRYSLRARWKALAGLVVAVGLAWIQAPALASDSATLSLLQLQVPRDPFALGFLLTLLYWVMPQAYNLIDGADGLALGCSIIVLVAIAIGGAPQPLLLGGLTGVLTLNWPRAKCFLGDSGSLLLGLTLALLAVRTFGPTNPDAILWLFAYPLADVVMVVVIRLATGQPLGQGDRNHLHHHWKRLLGRFSRLRVPILWLQVALCCSGALLDGFWKLIPAVGLVALVAQVVGFSMVAIRGARIIPLRRRFRQVRRAWSRV